MHLKEETQRRQQAEQQLLHIQHGSLPATSPQGSPLLATSDLGSALQHDACQVSLCYLNVVPVHNGVHNQAGASKRAP